MTVREYVPIETAEAGIGNHGESADDAIATATAYYAARRELDDIARSSCFVFRLGSEWLAIPAGMLDEVISLRPTHALPHRRGNAAVGLVSVHSDIVVHVSLAGLLGISDDSMAHADQRAHSVPRVVIVADARGRLAFTADEVLGFHSYDPATLRPVPSTLVRAVRSYAVAMLVVGDRVVGVLDGASMVASLSLLLS